MRQLRLADLLPLNLEVLEVLIVLMDGHYHLLRPPETNSELVGDLKAFEDQSIAQVSTRVAATLSELMHPENIGSKIASVIIRPLMLPWSEDGRGFQAKVQSVLKRKFAECTKKVAQRGIAVRAVTLDTR